MFTMEQIEHKHIQVNGLKLHVAEIGGGSSPAVVFLHGFPEIWYSWRHQMIAVAEAGYRAIALDYRGYGLSDPPPEPEKATYSDLLADLFELLHALSISKAFLIAKDFGARVAYLFALLHHEKVSGIITLGSLSEEFNLMSFNVEAPALFIMGEKDYFFKFPGMEDYIKGEKAKAFVPKMETVYVREGSHFVQEQFPEQVNQLILSFLKSNT